MTSTTTTDGGLVEVLTQIVSGAQTEIVVFIIAIVAHTVLFGKYRVGRSFRPKGWLQDKGKECDSPAPLELGQALTRAVLPLLREEGAGANGANAGAVQRAVAREMERQLQGLQGPQGRAEAAAALTSVLRNSGNKLNAALLGATREVVARQGLRLDAELGEALLQACFRLRLSRDFDAVLEQVVEAGAVAPGVLVLALRAALRDADLPAALGHLRRLADTWRSDAAAATSAAPQSLLQQLLRLAADTGKLEPLLRQLRDSQLLTPWAVASALAECAERSDEPTLRTIEALARGWKVPLPAAAYAALLHAASPEQALKLLEEAAETGQAEKPVLLAALGRAAAPADAEAGWREVSAAVVRRLVPGGTAPEVAAALLGLGGDGRLGAGSPDEAVLELYERHFLGVRWGDARALRLVAEAALRAGRTDLLKALAATSDSAAQVALLKTLAGERRLEDAGRLFRACAVKAPCHYNAFLDACVDCGDLQAAERVMAEATAAGAADVVTHNTLIKARLQGGDLQRAREAIDTMRSLGLQPNIVTFNELVHATIKTDLEAAWALVAEMSSCGLKPNHITCSILLKSIQLSSKAVDVQRALAAVEAIGSDVDEVLLSSVLEACIRVGRSDLLVDQLRKLCTGKRQVLQVKGAQTYGSIIRAYGVIRDPDGAWGAWREMHAKAVPLTSITLGCMVEAIAGNGNPEAAHRLIREAVSTPATRSLVNAVIYCSVLKGFSHMKNFARVWAVYQEMLEGKVQFSIVTYNTLIDGLARCREINRAMPLLEEMARDGLEPNIITLSALIKGYCQDNRLDSAFKLLDHMKNDLKIRPDEITYNTLLDGCARQGLYDRGLTVLKEMEDSGLRPSNFTLSVLVKLASRGGKLEQAFGIFEEISQKYRIRPNVHVYSALVQSCVMNGDIPRSLEVLERMVRERVFPDVRTYTLLLRGCISSSAADDAAGLLRAAVGLSGAHPKLASFQASTVKPRGGLPTEVITEVLEGIAGRCRREALALQLLRDLKGLPGLRLDPKLPMQLTSRACRRR